MVCIAGLCDGAESDYTVQQFIQDPPQSSGPRMNCKWETCDDSASFLHSNSAWISAALPLHQRISVESHCSARFVLASTCDLNGNKVGLRRVASGPRQSHMLTVCRLQMLYSQIVEETVANMGRVALPKVI